MNPRKLDRAPEPREFGRGALLLALLALVATPAAADVCGKPIPTFRVVRDAVNWMDEHDVCCAGSLRVYLINPDGVPLEITPNSTNAHLPVVSQGPREATEPKEIVDVSINVYNPVLRAGMDEAEGASPRGTHWGTLILVAVVAFLVGWWARRPRIPWRKADPS